MNELSRRNAMIAAMGGLGGAVVGGVASHTLDAAQDGAFPLAQPSYPCPKWLEELLLLPENSHLIEETANFDASAYGIICRVLKDRRIQDQAMKHLEGHIDHGSFDSTREWVAEQYRIGSWPRGDHQEDRQDYLHGMINGLLLARTTMDPTKTYFPI